jgi:DNA mismatch endonuclease (patch repair protein)
MSDIVASAVRSRMMSGIGGKNTRPEILVRKSLFAAGYRFRLHRKDLPGAPDIVLPTRKIAVFVHGCFWHMHAGCKFAKLPMSNAVFWEAKLRGNSARDKRSIDALRSLGWRILIVWECATRGATSPAQLGLDLTRWIAGSDPTGEISAAKP